MLKLKLLKIKCKINEIPFVAFIADIVKQYAIFKNGCLATSGATVGERNKLELMTSQNIKLRIICKDADKLIAFLHWPKV